MFSLQPVINGQEYLHRPHTLLPFLHLSCLCPGCCPSSSSSLFTLPSQSYAFVHTAAGPEVGRVFTRTASQHSVYPRTDFIYIVPNCQKESLPSVLYLLHHNKQQNEPVKFKMRPKRWLVAATNKIWSVTQKKQSTNGPTHSFWTRTINSSNSLQ